MISINAVSRFKMFFFRMISFDAACHACLMTDALGRNRISTGVQDKLLAGLTAYVIMENILEWYDIINRTSRCLIQLNSLKCQTVTNKQG